MWTAFILGLAGSGHCIGMCGPIAALVPGQAGTTSSQKLWKAVSYNAGRISVYTLIGLVFGFFGKGLFIAGFQQFISVFFGVLLIVGVVFPLVLKRFKPNSFLFTKVNQLKQLILPLLNKKSAGASYLIGALNALLPCGLVYVALAGAILLGAPLLAAQYMAVFGLGTAGVMLLVALGAGFLKTNFRAWLLKLAPIAMVLVGMLFVLRGLNLGIPYVSPKIANGTEVSCH